MNLQRTLGVSNRFKRATIKVLLLILTLVSVSTTPTFAVEKIRYVDDTNSVDEHGKYFISLLKLSLEKTKPLFGDYELLPESVSMRQDRQFKGVMDGKLDLIWTVTSQQRENDARPIRIPLLKGLIGYRVLVVKQGQSETYQQITSIPQLAKYTAVQGHDWPDTVILQHAGLKVEKIVWHKSMYKLVSSGIADYFPRSLLEVFEELEKSHVKGVEINPHHIIVYPSAMYFFVSKANEGLANRVRLGLNMAIEDGSFDALFYNFSGHKKAFSSFPLQQATKFKISNPLIPSATPLSDKRLWLNFE